MKKKKIIYILLIFQLCMSYASCLENKIILKINNEIITTYDIKQEERYLLVLNQNLKRINQNKLKNLATNSIIREKIKEIELIKYYQIDEILDDANLKMIIKNLYQSIGFQNENKFKNYLETQNLKFSLVKRKLAIEMLWNNLIFKKFNNRVVIDKIEINKNR